MATKKLYRDTKAGKVAGVCSGFAEYIDADVTLVRLVTFLVIFFSGIIPGLIAYFAAAIIMPVKA